jgi:hypothetical protein
MRSLVALAMGGLVLLGGQVGTGLAQAPVPPPERFVLSGVIMFDDGQGVAWLQEPSLTQNRVVARRPGDSVGPWRLTKLLGNRVELEGPTGTVIVPLHNAGAVGAGGVGADPAASAPAARARRERAAAGDTPAEALPSPAAASSEGGAAVAAQASRGGSAARRSERLAQMAERGQSDGESRQRNSEGRQRDGEGRGRAASAARAGSSAQSQNPNVISLSPGDPRRGGGLGQLFGGQ